MLTLILAMSLLGDPPSGPAAGDKLADVNVKGAYAPNEGKEFNLLDRAKKEPTVIVFVQKFSRPTFRFLKEIDKRVAKEDGLHAAYVWVTDDVGKTDEYLKRAKDSLAFHAVVAISLDGAGGPNGYGLNDQVDVTVVLARDGKSVQAIGLVGPNETNAPKIAAAITELVKKK